MEQDILLNYQKQWIALTSDRSQVIYAANSIKELTEKIKKQKSKDLIVTYVLPANTFYSPLCH